MQPKRWIRSFAIVSILFLLSYQLYDIVVKNTKILSVKSTDIVYFSDSVMRSHAACEANKSAIDDIIRDNGIDIINIDHGAYSPIIYKNYIKTLPSNTRVIIPINIRSFSEEWFDRPSYKFYKERIRLAILSLDIVDIVSILKEYVSNAFIDYEKIIVTRKNQNLGKIKDIEKLTKIEKDIYCDSNSGFLQDNLYKDKLSIKYKYHYAYNLANTHKMFRYLDEIINYADKKNIKILFYITPINFEHLNIFLEKEFLEIIENNINTIINYLQTKNATFINLSKEINGSDFIDRQHACEHLNFRGRKFIADAISEHKFIKLQLPTKTTP